MSFSAPDVYSKHLTGPQGYPLWTPQLKAGVPLEYQRGGLKIGDIGCISRDGGFDVLFNITLPRDKQPSRSLIPKDFAPILIDQEHIATHDPALPAHYVASSDTVELTARHVDDYADQTPRRAQYEFGLSKEDGAILILPEGASSCDLQSERRFLDEAIRRGLAWYQCAVEDGGRLVNNNTLYLVTGFHKAHSWSLGAAGRVSHMRNQRTVKFKIGRICPDSLTAEAYSWDIANGFEERMGPLRHNPAHILDEGGHDSVPNQTIFIRGFRITVNELLCWKKVSVKTQDYVRSVLFGFGSSIVNGLSGGLRGTSKTSFSGNENSALNQDILVNHCQLGEDAGVTIQRIPETSNTIHPGDSINRYILKENPDAMVAITHDSLWIEMLQMGLLKLADFTREEDLQRVLSIGYKTTVDDGVVYLQRDTPQSLPSVPDGGTTGDHPSLSPASLHPVNTVFKFTDVMTPRCSTLQTPHQQNMSDESKTYLVLSIDGGGFRGLTCLMILAHLMAQLSSDNEETPPPRPCQIFDLICGTSSGGLIAILLGRFGLSCEEAIHVYREIGEGMFGGETDSRMVWKQIIGSGHLPSAMFERKLESIIEEYAGNKGALLNPPTSDPDAIAHDSTKTFVNAVPTNGSAGVDAHRIRSYARPLGGVDPTPFGHKWTIFEAARGTCAIPLYLSPLNIPTGHSTFTYQDAGYTGFNNPARAAIDEAEQLFGDDATITLVSLGTGLRSLVDDGTLGNKSVKGEYVDGIALQIIKNLGELGKDTPDALDAAQRAAEQLLEVANDTEITHLDVREQFRRHRGQKNYYRFNPDRGLGDIELTDFREEYATQTIINAWLTTPDEQAAISSVTGIMKRHYERKNKTQPGHHSTNARVAKRDGIAPSDLSRELPLPYVQGGIPKPRERQPLPLPPGLVSHASSNDGTGSPLSASAVPKQTPQPITVNMLNSPSPPTQPSVTETTPTTGPLGPSLTDANNDLAAQNIPDHSRTAKPTSYDFRADSHVSPPRGFASSLNSGTPGSGELKNPMREKDRLSTFMKRLNCFRRRVEAEDAKAREAGHEERSVTDDDKGVKRPTGFFHLPFISRRRHRGGTGPKSWGDELMV